MNLMSLYILLSLIFGLITSRIYHSDSKKFGEYMDKFVIVLILILIFLIGTFLGTTFSNISNLYLIPVSFLITILAMSGTILTGVLFTRRYQLKKGVRTKYNVRWTLMIFIALMSGILGAIAFNIKGLKLDLVLYVLLFVIGYQMNFNIKDLRIYAKEIIMSLIAALVGIVFVIPLGLILSLNLKALLLSVLCLGWYTFSGPYIGLTYGALYGSLAFLINLFREQLTIILSPYLSRFGHVSLIASAGATAMDTSLPFIKVQFGEKVVIPSFGAGGIITLLVPILVPLLYYL